MRAFLAVLSLGAALAVPAAASAASTVHLRGTAYEFNNVKVKLAGAQVRVAEDPTLGATVKQDGTYDLKVPDGKQVTPYINAAGHHTIYLQTFATDGQDLENVNFQVPSDAIYGALAALLQVPLGADGNPAGCAIVSTFSTRNVRALAFDDFTGYGAHGVAGATATTKPALAAPVYFNKDVIPDRAQLKSSKDGGVIWPVVPAGTYTISAKGFAPFTASCVPGRIVNANPPWGLHQYGKANHTEIKAGWSGDRFEAIRAAHLPRGSTITVSAPGHPTRTLIRSSTRSVMTADASKLGLRISDTITLRATAPAHDGTLVTVRNGKPSTRCVPLGETRPRARCPR
ncbi:MAG TPA: hypothetical protein VNT55_11335 [Baekduia sp.]|nr:hypothetical protein [Baekduia sp.]